MGLIKALCVVFKVCVLGAFSVFGAIGGFLNDEEGGGPQKLDNVLSSGSLHKERR